MPSLEVCARRPPGARGRLTCFESITGIHAQQWVFRTTVIPEIRTPFEVYKLEQFQSTNFYNNRIYPIFCPPYFSWSPSFLRPPSYLRSPLVPEAILLSKLTQIATEYYSFSCIFKSSMIFQLVFKASFQHNFDIIGLDEISYQATLCSKFLCSVFINFLSIELHRTAVFHELIAL